MEAWIGAGVLAMVGLVAGIANSSGGTQRSMDGVASQLVKSARDRLDAAKQDTAPLQRLADAQYGGTLLQCARMLVSPDSRLETLTQLNIADLSGWLQAEQEAAFRQIQAMTGSASR